VAIVRDRRTSRYAATVAVAGRGFGLAERVEQERLLAGWGDALAPFTRDAGPVAAVRWSEWAAPAGIEPHLAYLDAHGHPDSNDSAVASYRDLLTTSGPAGMRHETLLTVIVDAARLNVTDRATRDHTCADTLLAELRLFSARLQTAGLRVSEPLSPRELATRLRTRLDPR